MVATLLVFALIAADAVPTAPPPRGTLAVTIPPAEAGARDDDQAFADAVGQAFGAADFTLLPEHSRFVAEVAVARVRNGVVATRVGRDPASAAVGSWGPAVSVPLGSKKTVLRDLVTTTLTVRLFTRADHRPVWDGSATTTGVDGDAVAAKLARAAVASYPRSYPGTVSVP